jgi:phosphotransferase system IIB component
MNKIIIKYETASSGKNTFGDISKYTIPAFVTICIGLLASDTMKIIENVIIPLNIKNHASCIKILCFTLKNDIKSIAKTELIRSIYAVQTGISVQNTTTAVTAPMNADISNRFNEDDALIMNLSIRYRSIYDEIKFIIKITSAYITILITSKMYYTPCTQRKMSNTVVE